MLITSGKFWSFVGGIALACVGSALAKQPKTREVAVNVISKGMLVKDACAESMESIKEDASDLAEQARRQARLDAAIADRKAAIEARVREQVEAEFAAEQAQATQEDAKA